MPITRVLIKGGMTIPSIRSVDPDAYPLWPNWVTGEMTIPHMATFGDDVDGNAHKKSEASRLLDIMNGFKFRTTHVDPPEIGSQLFFL